MVVLAAHGGAGATTLARALHLPATTRPVANRALLVVAARTTAPAAARVVELVAALPADQPVVLALTADGPIPQPAAVRAMRRLLADRLSGTVLLPWQARWRHEPPSSASADRAWTAQAVALERLLHTLTAQPADPTDLRGAPA